MTTVATYTYRQGAGETHQFSGKAPTERAPDAQGVIVPLDPSEIDHYVRIVAYQDPVTGNWSPAETMDVQLVNGVFSEIVDIDALAPGKYAYWYRTVDTDGRESVDSDSISMEVQSPLAAPNPPSVLG